jgi:glycyl-tRNA synthetase beta chain
MPELLLEVGCEELPASFIKKAYTDLEKAICDKLRTAGVEFGDSRSMGTPRRLIVQVQSVQDRQPDVEKDFRGPGVSAAFDADGNPTKALEGFCRGQGVSPSEVRREADYVWVTKKIEGKPTRELLTTILPDCVTGLTFDKAMRWGSSRLRFARPLRWLLASLGGEAVEFEIEGIVSGLNSRGHRFISPHVFRATNLDDLLQGLRHHSVEPEPERRRSRILEEAQKVASGRPDMSEALIDENTFLTEWPVAIEGSFREEYLELPSAVLVTAMAKHEKMFPVRNDQGCITNRFVSIRNGGVDEVVREGNAWVLNARFNDAKFFFDEDRKHTLDEFLEKTRGIIFQEKLGTVHQRAFRLERLSHFVAEATGADAEETEQAKQAALYSKADLSTGLVSELPALQGAIGGEYARREGFPDPVCWAITSQYDLSMNPTVDCSGARCALRTVITDQLDKVVGFLGIRQIPTGSSDPYGLRRAVTMLIEAALLWPTRFSGYNDLVSRAQDGYFEQIVGLFHPGEAMREMFEEVFHEMFRSRYEAMFEEVRHDLIQAALLDDYLSSGDVFDPQGVRFRLKVLEKLSDDVPFIQTATRPQNILTAAVNKSIGFTFHDPLDGLEEAQIDSPSGDELLKLARKVGPSAQTAAELQDVEALIVELDKLAGPINAFFDSTMVMAEDEAVRSARLTLLHGVNLILRHAGDFSKIVIAGA